MRIDGNAFIVTGAASGLGGAVTRYLVARGGRVTMVDINGDALSEASRGLDEQVIESVTDVTSPEQVEAMLDLTESTFGGLKGAVQCAGILGAGRVLSRQGPHDLEQFDQVIRVNLIGTFNVLRLAAERMAKGDADEEGERGVIINTSSVAAFEGQIGQASYSASKGGVASLTLPAARELSRFGIRVVAIAPGIFRTPMVEAMPPAVQQSLVDQAVFPGRLGEPDEFAALAGHIIQNRMLNGSVVRLDGAVRMASK